MTCFTHFSLIRTPQSVIFLGKLSTIIIFKPCKFANVDIVFCVLQKVPQSFKGHLTSSACLHLMKEKKII